MRRRRLLLSTTAALVLTSGLVALPSEAADPPASAISPPASGSQSRTYAGSVLTGANPASECIDAPPVPNPFNDVHTVTISNPANRSFRATFRIIFPFATGQAEANDLILSVYNPNGSMLGSSDGAGPVEQVIADDLPEGAYRVVTCGFVNVGSQPYDGEIELTTAQSPGGEPSLPAADAGGLAFSATVAADPQRDEAEPLIESAIDGTTYTCGPTGFSTGADYAQVSTDGGDQFHLLGTGPRGQQAPGGGGDCSLATSPVVNPTSGKPNYAYTGLEGLVNFSTAVSPDNGRTLTGTSTSESIPGVDRQWTTFLDEDTVLLNYNALAPRRVVVQRSNDRGLTYGPPITASPNPLFPGQIRSLPASFNMDPNVANRVNPVAYFPWTRSASGSGATAVPPRVQLAVSTDGGTTWKNCVAANEPRGFAGFPVADHDVAGNLYVAYTDEGDFHTYLTVLKAADFASCTNIGSNPGFSAPTQVDRGAVRSTVFPWLAAGGEPGRVAVTFYGTESQGNPNLGTFDATWHVYVNQSLDALADAPTISQVKATTHPFHYDSICLDGLGCDLGAPPGDRSLADFFAIEYNPLSKKLQIVYNQTNKVPDDAAGRVATPAVVTQIAGPSNGGGNVTPDLRPVVRTSSTDPTGDAFSDYSNTNFTPGTNIPGAQLVQPTTDFTSVSVGPELGSNGQPVANGGFTVTMKVANLTTPMLNTALTTSRSQSLLWLFRFFNGYTASAASASYSPSAGFRFGYDDFTTNTSAVQCIGASNNEKCQLYPQARTIAGTVNQVNGTITLTVPRSLLRGLSGPEGNGERPVEVGAGPGTRFYDATAYSLGNSVGTTQALQSFLYPFDNTAAFDFVLPAGSGPDSVIPEVPFAAALPVAGLGVAALVLLARRRRRAPSAA